MEAVETCPICETAGKPVVKVPDLEGYGPVQVMDCPTCQCTYLDPRMDAAEMAAYYRQGIYAGQYANSDGFYERRRALVRAAFIYQYIDTQTEPRRVLDVGCGHGHLLQRLRDLWRHVETVGYDLHQYPDAVHPVVTDKAQITGTFNFIACVHALEHTYDPVAELAWMVGLLAPDGLLMLELPTKRKIMVEHPLTFHHAAAPILMARVNLGTYTVIDAPNLESCLIFARKAHETGDQKT